MILKDAQFEYNLVVFKNEKQGVVNDYIDGLGVKGYYPHSVSDFKKTRKGITYIATYVRQLGK